jgi:hypothetical protein
VELSSTSNYPELMRLLFISVSLLLALPSVSATVYKSVDERGRVTFSDTVPLTAVSVESIVVQVQQPHAPELYLERMQAMTAVTDKIAAQRKEREQNRESALQRHNAGTFAGYPGMSGETVYVGYGGARRWLGSRPPHYPVHPVVRPPLQPVRGPILVNQYPASVVRRSYGPHVASVFQGRPLVQAYPY